MNNCQVFTPNYIVESMLDRIQYTGDNIKNKTILEPSFGDGAFLIPIVQRIIKYIQMQNLSQAEAVKILNNVYAVEIDKKYYDITLRKLNNLLAEHNIQYDWPNIVCEDTLHYNPNIKFDLCVGNPPYQKIHHLTPAVRAAIEEKFEFGVGNTDLYVVFFEVCLKLLKTDGQLCFITPNSYFRNSSQKPLRKYFAEHNLVESITDYANVKVFKKAATYTAIIHLNMQNTKTTEYTLMKNVTDTEYTVQQKLPMDGSQWNFSSPDNMKFLRQIEARSTKLKDLCDIQHGISTNADAIYIIAADAAETLEPDFLRPVIKGSTLNDTHKIIFPYLWNKESKKYEVVPENLLKKTAPKTYAYLLQHKETLLHRNMENNLLWYQYARSQGIQNTKQRKIVLKHVLSSTENTCQFKELDENTLVYSGIYIIVKNPAHYTFIKTIIMSNEFFKYLFAVGKNMAGGYRNVSAKFVKEFGIVLNVKE